MLQLSKASVPSARRYGTTLVACLCAVHVAQAAPARIQREPTSYCAYDLGPNLIPESISNRNQIAGTAILGELTQAFVWDWPSGVRLLGALPGATMSIGNDINDRGELVGASGDGGLLQQAFVWDERNGMRQIVTLAGESSTALRINEVGAIMGLSGTASQTPCAAR